MSLPQKIKILITGFEKFGDHNINPTEELVDLLRQKSTPMSQIETLILPVSYKKAFELLFEKIQSFKPDIVLSLGLAGGRDYVALERVAINCESASIPDNDGDLAFERKILMDQADGIFSNLPLVDLQAKLKASGFDIKISDTAGTYVCNSLMFKTLAKSKDHSFKSGFIHFPHIKGSAAQKKESYEYTIEDFERIMLVIIETLCEQ